MVLRHREAVVLSMGLLHWQHEARRKVRSLYNDGPWREFKPPVRIERASSGPRVFVGFLRSEVEVCLLTAFGLLGDAEVLVDDGDKYLQHDNYTYV